MHGWWENYKKIIASTDLPTIQVGDFGIGFPRWSFEQFPDKDKFIRGNHDNPSCCWPHPNYMGDLGYRDGVYWYGGAFSVDQGHRTPYLTWWPEEELNLVQQIQAFNIYEHTRPRTVISHCCPRSIQNEIFDFKNVFDNKTIRFFDDLWDHHKPELWVFGHYHRSVDRVIDGCRFVCLNELETKVLDI